MHKHPQTIVASSSYALSLVFKYLLSTKCFLYDISNLYKVRVSMVVSQIRKVGLRGSVEPYK